MATFDANKDDASGASGAVRRFLGVSCKLPTCVALSFLGSALCEFNWTLDILLELTKNTVCFFGQPT